MRGRAARAHRRADGEAVYGAVVTLGEARRRPVPQMNPVRVEEEDGSQHGVLRQFFNRPAQGGEHVGKRFALNDQLQNPLLAFEQRFVLLALADVTGERHQKAPASFPECSTTDIDREDGSILAAMAGFKCDHLLGVQSLS